MPGHWLFLRSRRFCRTRLKGPNRKSIVGKFSCACWFRLRTSKSACRLLRAATKEEVQSAEMPSKLRMSLRQAIYSRAACVQVYCFSFLSPHRICAFSQFGPLLKLLSARSAQKWCLVVSKQVDRSKAATGKHSVPRMSRTSLLVSLLEECRCNCMFEGTLLTTAIQSNASERIMPLGILASAVGGRVQVYAFTIHPGGKLQLL